MATIDYTPAPIVGEFIQHYLPGELFYSFIVGPFGCVAGNTLIQTEDGPIPISDITRPVRVLSWNATTCRYQLSLCGGSFPKGRDYLYRVVTPAGEFDAAGTHRLLCDDGEYRPVRALRRGHVLASCSHTQQRTSEVLSRLKSPEDAMHYSQTLADYLAHCAASDRQRGQPFLQEEEADRESVQRRGGVRESAERFVQNVFSRIRDLRVRSLGHTHLSLCAGHTETGDFGYLVEPLRAVEACRAQSSAGGRIVGTVRRVFQSLRMIGRHQQKEESASRSHSCGLSPSKRTIVSVRRLDVKQIFWDMQVAETNNYVSMDGAIHHNSAKTTGALFKIAYMAGLQEPSPIDGIRRTRAVVVRNTAPQLADTTLKSWNIWFKDGVAGRWQATPKVFTLRFGDVECEVLFRALDTVDDVSKVLSLEVTFAVLDEFVQIPTEIREGLSGRCGRYPPKIEGGPTNFGMWGASNPGEEDTDWYKLLLEEKPDNLEYFHQPSGLSPDAENLENLPPGYYANLAKGKSESWIKQFIEAEWGYSVAGQPVVPTFNRELHVSKSPLTPNPHLPLIIGYDPGVQHSALLFTQMDLYGRLLVFDCLPLEGYGAQRMATDRLIPLLRTSKYAGLEVIIAPDPAANSRTQNDEVTVVEGLRKPQFKKWWVVKVGDTNLLTPRLEAIEHFTTRLTEKGPALVIDPGPGCRPLIRALQGGWRYKKTKVGDDRPEPDKNIHSHPGDGLTYAAQYHVKNEARVGRRGQQAPQQLPRFTNSYNQR